MGWQLPRQYATSAWVAGIAPHDSRNYAECFRAPALKLVVSAIPAWSDSA
jgi:hypothetical protein